MNISQLLEALKGTKVSLSIGEKLIAGLSVAILSMTVVFIVLVIIAGIISLLQREKKAEINGLEFNTQSKNEKNSNVQNEDIGELVAVITAAICASTGNNSSNIVVKKITRSNNSKSNWESMRKNTSR